MILRPLDPAPAGNEPMMDAWPVVERLQREKYESCWMITQPSHAALAGELAGTLKHNGIPTLDESLIRAIALHDAGWGQPDAEAIMRSRSRTAEPPRSFLQTGITEFLAAWTQSIEIAQKVDPAGGYMVSRHFWRLAEHRVANGGDKPAERKKLEAFLSSEATRQKKLAARQERLEDELERLTDVLQFCDLLSLYICSGAQQGVQFPEYFGVAAKCTVCDKDYRIDPALVENGIPFELALLRFPPLPGLSSQEVLVKFVG